MPRADELPLASSIDMAWPPGAPGVPGSPLLCASPLTRAQASLWGPADSPVLGLPDPKDPWIVSGGICSDTLTLPLGLPGLALLRHAPGPMTELGATQHDPAPAVPAPSVQLVESPQSALPVPGGQPQPQEAAHWLAPQPTARRRPAFVRLSAGRHMFSGARSAATQRAAAQQPLQPQPQPQLQPQPQGATSCQHSSALQCSLSSPASAPTPPPLPPAALATAAPPRGGRRAPASSHSGTSGASNGSSSDADAPAWPAGCAVPQRGAKRGREPPADDTGKQGGDESDEFLPEGERRPRKALPNRKSARRACQRRACELAGYEDLVAQLRQDRASLETELREARGRIAQLERALAAPPAAWRC